MKRLTLLCLFASACLLRAADAQPKTAEQILRIVRLSYALQNHKMDGVLRDDATGKVEPMELNMEKQVMRFRFKNQPPEIIHLDLNTTPATLYQVKPGGSAVVPASQMGNKVRNMELNYQDLSLAFLYWPRPQHMGEDRVSLQKCWKVRVTNPSAKREGPYWTVDIWVHQESGGAAKMEAYDFNSKLVKRFQVTKVQKVDGATTLKEMKIETFNPFDGSRKGRTYMTMGDPVRK
ncbi:MAG: outer membrane lipoprotein-sorting protein [Verrucomicrobiaceae bacterium]|nr:outer membrane lipoprotein-sorting protein [Verrucomicrobiaceae bacterium]